LPGFERIFYGLWDALSKTDFYARLHDFYMGLRGVAVIRSYTGDGYSFIEAHGLVNPDYQPRLLNANLPRDYARVLDPRPGDELVVDARGFSVKIVHDYDYLPRSLRDAVSRAGPERVASRAEHYIYKRELYIVYEPRARITILDPGRVTSQLPVVEEIAVYAPRPLHVFNALLDVLGDSGRRDAERAVRFCRGDPVCVSTVLGQSFTSLADVRRGMGLREAPVFNTLDFGGEKALAKIARRHPEALLSRLVREPRFLDFGYAVPLKHGECGCKRKNLDVRVWYSTNIDCLHRVTGFIYRFLGIDIERCRRCPFRDICPRWWLYGGCSAEPPSSR